MIISSDNQEGRGIIRQGRKRCNAQSSNEVKSDPDDGHHHDWWRWCSQWGSWSWRNMTMTYINAINVETGTPGTLLLHRGVAQETLRWAVDFNIVTCPEEWIYYPYLEKGLTMKRMSVLHKNSGGFGKSIPSAFKISLNLWAIGDEFLKKYLPCFALWSMDKIHRQALSCYNEALLAAPADPWDGQVKRRWLW